MGRREDLHEIISKAQEELLELDKCMTWREACAYMYKHKSKSGSVMGINEIGIYHSYAGIGILYSKHMFEGCDGKYKVKEY